MKPYRFIWDEEPSDEQLEQIMKEIAVDVREQTVRIQKIIQDRVLDEIKEARAKRGLEKQKLTKRDPEND